MIDSDGNSVVLPGRQATCCRNGHVKTAVNTYRSKAGHERCRDCRRKHKPLKDRACAICKTIFAGQGKRCPACAAMRHMSTLEEARTPVRSRMCSECHEVRPLEEFRLATADFQVRGAPQCSDRCLDCREGEEAFGTSPYERAKLQVVRVFGVPVREWINRPGHVLNDLHFLRMLAIQHSEARRSNGKPVRPDIDTRARLLWPRLREFLHPALATTRAAA